MPIEIRRDDGNEAIFKERYGFFKEKTSCVVDELQASGMILKIDSSRDLDSVYEDFVLAIKEGVDANYFERYMPKFRNHCELVLVVDEDTNKPVGEATRKEMREQNLWHRSSFVFVQNQKGEFVVTVRSMAKEYYPGGLDLAAGGVMGPDETNELNAARELEEELGIVREVEAMEVQGQY